MRKLLNLVITKYHDFCISAFSFAQIIGRLVTNKFPCLSDPGQYQNIMFCVLFHYIQVCLEEFHHQQCQNPQSSPEIKSNLLFASAVQNLCRICVEFEVVKQSCNKQFILYYSSKLTVRLGSFEVLEITIRRPKRRTFLCVCRPHIFGELLISAVFEIENKLLTHKRARDLQQGC